MALFDEIFPSKRNPSHVQTEWAEGWGDLAAGFGYAAEELTERKGNLGARVDQAGLAVFFLQRHRVEVVLKGLLDAAGGGVPSSHSLETLWERCEEVLRPRDHGAWNSFSAAHADLVVVLHRVDEHSYAFRYPVDTKGRPVERPDFIDLDALNKHVDDLAWAAAGYIDYLAESQAGA